MAAHAFATQWTVVDLTPEGMGTAAGVSQNGIVVGCRSIGNEIRAFVYANGSRQDLGAPAGSTSCALVVNNAGLVAGRIDGEITVWENGVPRGLGVQGSANGIGESGVVVGSYINGTTPQGSPATRAFKWANGVLSDLGFSGSAFGINHSGQIAVITQEGALYVIEPSGTVRNLGVSVTSARGFNDRGEIVGITSFGHGPEPFIYDGTVHQIPGAYSYASAVAINNAGQILASGEGVYGFLIEGGATVSIESLANKAAGGGTAWHHSEGLAINDRGWIVGADGSPNFHAFLLMPKEASVAAAAGNPVARAATRVRPLISRSTL